MICLNKIENRIKFKLKTGYYFELIMLAAMKLLGTIKSKITNENN